MSTWQSSCGVILLSRAFEGLLKFSLLCLTMKCLGLVNKGGRWGPKEEEPSCRPPARQNSKWGSSLCSWQWEISGYDVLLFFVLKPPMPTRYLFSGQESDSILLFLLVLAQKGFLRWCQGANWKIESHHHWEAKTTSFIAAYGYIPKKWLFSLPVHFVYRNTSSRYLKKSLLTLGTIQADCTRWVKEESLTLLATLLAQRHSFSQKVDARSGIWTHASEDTSTWN